MFRQEQDLVSKFRQLERCFFPFIFFSFWNVYSLVVTLVSVQTFTLESSFFFFFIAAFYLFCFFNSSLKIYILSIFVFRLSPVSCSSVTITLLHIWTSWCNSKYQLPLLLSVIGSPCQWKVYMCFLADNGTCPHLMPRSPAPISGSPLLVPLFQPAPLPLCLYVARSTSPSLSLSISISASVS